MDEAERGKKTIFDQDSNLWVPWDPIIKKDKQESKQNIWQRQVSNCKMTWGMKFLSSPLPLDHRIFMI